MKENIIITLAHGSGGKLTHDLINNIFKKHFSNNILLQNGDSAIINNNAKNIAFTTDSYVITPIFFNGGDIGKLSICGTINDLVVCGAKPLYISCGFIIEEGLLISDLEKVVQSMAKAAKEAGVKIVTGDTKVVEKGGADKLFINTSGIGEINNMGSLSASRIQNGDKVIISGTIGDHGTSILIDRENLKIKGDIRSDCCPLNSMIQELLNKFGEGIHVLRDPTRGGVATTLNEFVNGSDRNNFGIEIIEEHLPIKQEVQAVCDMLGLDPLYMANEGKVIAIVHKDICDEVVELLRKHEYGNNAAIIGEVTYSYPGKVYMKTTIGGSRIIDMLVGDQLPRIC